MFINRKTVVLLHDNARPHATKVTRFCNLASLFYPYSPDLTPTDFYLFKSLQNDFHAKKFTENNQVNQVHPKVFQSKQLLFYLDGNKKLIGKWKKINENNKKLLINTS